MKKITLGLVVACMLLLTVQPLQSIAATTAPTGLVSSTAASAEAKTLLLRLSEINKMDKKMLTSSDKKVLRTEVLSIKQQLKDIGGGVYLSAGALILIVILLIILL